jgi:hypothetical protein
MYAANASGPTGTVNDGGANEIGYSPGGGPGLRHALAGLQAGVLGALVLFACLMLGSLWNGRSIWVVPNLFATTFFGSHVYRNQLLRTSWTGIALIVAVYGGLGTLWGCIWRDVRTRWLGLYGAVAGLCVYFLFYDFLWRHVNPLVTLYAPDRQLELGHLLFGLTLARSPLYARRIANSVLNKPATPLEVYDVEAQEVRSGGAIT